MDHPTGDSRYHEPVLGGQVMDLLALRAGGLYLDGTVGGGGHARLLLERCSGCRILAVDRDAEALGHARRVLRPYGSRIRFMHSRFDRAVEDAEVMERGLEGALLDLGVSSRQLDSGRRGFSFRPGTALDMRMEPSEKGATAAELLSEADEGELTRIFRELGEEPRARSLAREVVRRRSATPFRTSDDLVAALAAALGRAPYRREKARVFQALRIEVNHELEALESALDGLCEALLPGGVLAVISYHSLEDRTVKCAFRDWSRSCICPPDFPVCRCRGRALGEALTRRPVRPGPDELERNPRAGSARLRAWRKAA